MRKIIGKLTAVLIYIFILCCLLKSEWTQLFSLKMSGLLLLGTGILCLPCIDRKKALEEWQNIIGKNALMAGYLEAFMLLFASMSSSDLMREGLLTEMGLDLRPILYGYILYIILERESEEEKGDEKSGEDKIVEAENKYQNRGDKRREGLEQNPAWENEKLTKREREVAALAAKNLSNREIAQELFISEATVKKHMTNIFEKLEIDSRNQLK